MKAFQFISLLILSAAFLSCGHNKKPMSPDQEKAADSTVKHRDTIGIDHTRADSITNLKRHKL